jgi:hypothetical protein
MRKTKPTVAKPRTAEVPKTIQIRRSGTRFKSSTREEAPADADEIEEIFEE